MAVDPNIKRKADDIRNKIEGKEVRESLASGLEAISSDVVDTVNRQGNVESQFQDVIENTTDKDVISAPEIIAARDGEPNLKARLDKNHQQVTAQLAQTAKRFDGFSINPMYPPAPMVGAKGNANYYNDVNQKYYVDEAMTIPATDDQPAFQAIVNHLASNGGGLIEVPKGTFLLKSGIEWETKVSMIGTGMGTTKFVTEGELFDMIYNDRGTTTGSSAQTDPSVWIEDVVFRDFQLDARGLTYKEGHVRGKGLFILYMRRARFENLFIQNTIGTGMGCDFLVDTVIQNNIVSFCGRNRGNGGSVAGQSGIGIGSKSVDDEPVTVINNFCYGNGNYGIFVESQGNSKLGDHARIVNNFVSENRVGIGNAASGATLIQGNSSINNEIGISLFSSAIKTQVLDNKVEGNTLYGVFVEDLYNDELAIRGNDIKKNKVGVYFEASTLNRKLKMVTVDDNLIRDNLEEGILVDRILRVVSLDNNKVYGNGKSRVVGKRVGIKINKDLEVFTLSGNSITDDDLVQNVSIGFGTGVTLLDGVIDGNNIPRFEPILTGVTMSNVLIGENIGIKKPVSYNTSGRLVLDGSGHAKVPASVGDFSKEEDFLIETKIRFSTQSLVGRTILSKTNTNYTGVADKARGWLLRTNVSGRFILEGYLTDDGPQLIRTSSRALSGNGTYWVRLACVGGVIKLFISTDGITFTEEVLTATSGSDAEIRNMFGNELGVNTLIGMTFSGVSGYRYGFWGDIFHVKVWKGTSDTSVAPLHHYPFVDYGINQPVTDVAYGANGQAYGGAIQTAQ